MSRREKAPTGTTTTTTTKRSYRTLASVLKYFIDLPLTVEGKDGRQYRGILQEANHHMALVLSDVELVAPKQRSTTITTSRNNKLPFLHIRGHAIRYIHFPVHVDLAAGIQAGVARERAARHKYQRGVRRAPPPTL